MTRHEFWDSLNKEEKQLAFMAVTDLITRKIVREEYSYDRFLKEILSFEEFKEVDSCFGEIHNYILCKIEDMYDRII